MRTVYRDVASLQARRVPIEGAPGIGYVLRRGFDLPPLMFTADEIEAIAVGARLVAAPRCPLQDAADRRAHQGDRGRARGAAVAVPGDTVLRLGRRAGCSRTASIWRPCAKPSATPQAAHPLWRRERQPQPADDLADRDGLLRRRHLDRRLVRAAQRLSEFPRRADRRADVLDEQYPPDNGRMMAEWMGLRQIF